MIILIFAYLVSRIIICSWNLPANICRVLVFKSSCLNVTRTGYFWCFNVCSKKEIKTSLRYSIQKYSEKYTVFQWFNYHLFKTTKSIPLQKAFSTFSLHLPAIKHLNSSLIPDKRNPFGQLNQHTVPDLDG